MIEEESFSAKILVEVSFDSSMINALFKFSNMKPNHTERALKNTVNSIFPNILSWHILYKVNVR